MLKLTQLFNGSTMYYIGGLFMSYSIRFTEKERKLADSYAKLHGISLSEALKSALFEKIEDEFDIALYNEAKKEFEKNPKTYTLKELKDKHGL